MKKRKRENADDTKQIEDYMKQIEDDTKQNRILQKGEVIP
ncbi:hypothetical protein T4B_6978 [Trichinella pseudospiralis]|uniref:Uncharacterized protein n=1 Tax=Trichinella pseudospiralis TaxID=6337 RepID=A0A0V1GGX0_TRIPS|nr:hypothetical protein T4C_12670 [Trichinella pseudospiralis]KRY98473.1 hypothetical protein T4B_6978 [Trichinella pseudospiralis]